VNIYKTWSFIGFDSASQHVGIPVLNQLNCKADFGFFDSWHTLDHLMKEIQCFEMVAKDRFILALDDAYYTKRSENYSYLNMIRAKLGLDPVMEPANNKCEPFYMEVEKYFLKKYPEVKKIKDSYKKEYDKDIFFDYYKSDRESMGKHGMEIKDRLDHRFDAWSISVES
jgi:hypothetical protein